MSSLQGWRVEVHAFPQLTSVGAWRGGRDGVPHYGGFYTQDEVSRPASAPPPHSNRY